MKPVILLHSGHYFDFTRPAASLAEMSEEILIENIAHSLARLCRYTGHVVADHYSVGQHSWHASFIGPGRYARQRLLHDGTEFVLGDMSSPLKALMPDYKKLEHEIECALLDRLDIERPLHPTTKRADLIMLTTERRDLMPADSNENWEIIKDIPALEEKIEPWNSFVTKERFIMRYWALRERG